MTAPARPRPRWRDVEDRLLGVDLALHGVAVCRILIGLALLGLLATNFGARHVLWGEASVWVDPYRATNSFEPWLWNLGALPPALFTTVYLAVMACAVAFVVGWRAWLFGPLLWLGSWQLVELNPLLGDQGDNIARIGLLLLLFTRNSARWSFDADRAALGVPGAFAYLVGDRWGLKQYVDVADLRRLRTAVHNLAVIVLAVQVVTIYVAAGFYKVQGGPWQYGTALYYPLQLDEFRPFPFLNDLLPGLPVIMAVSTMAVVAVQLFFPFLLLHRQSRRFALVAVVLMHLGIAVLMGLPWFSLSMVAFDALFVSTATYLVVQERAIGAWEWSVIRIERTRSRRGQRVLARHEAGLHADRAEP
ncbi:hypothetical protein HMPREF0063_11732 [Aeromicrobium marinum DSM 15272]|uniref:HTTM-like domain-containing protein n=1 Tax=Aeromicrobium marinum DSM 15272 TaxID=585531 RepID=E2SDE6_9ACTN|nr:HTTM domain-containing protein [Aeromicrobium marinum]EFQ82523.1 hypothetical protein HMPREF0063_11732 [Aeromicrobium marinum DSM 15272]